MKSVKFKARRWTSWRNIGADSIICMAVYAVVVLLAPGGALGGAALELKPFHRVADGILGADLVNVSAKPLYIRSVSFQLVGQVHSVSVGQALSAHEDMKILFPYPEPAVPGSYVVITTAHFTEGGVQSWVKTPGIFNHKSTSYSLSNSRLLDARIGARGQIVLVTGDPHSWRLILPEGLHTLSTSYRSGRKTFHLARNGPLSDGVYPVFAVLEKEVNGIHTAGIVRGNLTAADLKALTPYRGRLPGVFLLMQALAFLVVAGTVLLRQQKPGRTAAAFAKFSSRMFLLTICYYFLKNVDLPVQMLADLAGDGLPKELFYGILDTLRGHNYENFFRYFIDPYWAACIIFCLPYFYFLEHEKPVDEDKYASMILSLLTVRAFLSRDARPHWKRSARMGIMTLLLKLFFVPLLVSWVINNAMYQKQLLLDFKWDLLAVNSYLVALFIYLDTLIYSVGYLAESGRLDNEIRSVEPTLLGWVVCLWCYPPFNRFSFRIFDLDSVRLTTDYPFWLTLAMTCAVTILWGIFMWASLALGFKASNLTNRGIVRNGPYRFVRHPAYTAKLLVWIIQGVFFAQFGLGILLGFAFIYYLRAWTEERHLARDPDYRAYQEEVPWRFVPGLV